MGPERNGCRELVGFHRAQLRAFSKRTVAIGAALEAGPAALTAKGRMRAGDRASLATRDRKDPHAHPRGAA
ncbi:MAG: relaxase domain-containing protein [Acidimicrobiia bacterium]|nr:relaxase domain-containing protein [Acidimicrobiia bacterium]